MAGGVGAAPTAAAAAAQQPGSSSSHQQHDKQKNVFVRTQDPALTAALESLGPEAYTSHRLKHATSQHLYLTTRRCFIGPIPEGWLKSHRKEWYKHYLHINRGDKVPSFNADANTGRHKRLTGLDFNGPSASAAFRSSFPQPEDVGSTEEEEEDQDEGDDKDERQGGSEDDGSDVDTIRAASSTDGDDQREVHMEAPPAIDIPRSGPNADDPALRRESGKDAEAKLSSYTTAKTVLSPLSQTPATVRPAPMGRGISNGSSIATVGRATIDSETGASFETASEGSGIIIDEPGAPDASGLHRAASTVGSEASEENGGAETPRPGDAEGITDPFATPQPRNSTNANPFRDTLLTPSGAGPDSLTSKSPLIKGASPSSPNLSEDQPDRAEANVSDETPSREQTQAGAGELESAAPRPHSSGLVRFAEPDVQPMKREMQMRAKLAQHAQKRIPRRFTRGKLRDGEIVKVEKMLVRLDVTSGSEQPSDEYDEKDSRRVEARTVEKWREFMVVCRESHEEDAVLCLEMYKTRVIPASTQSKTKKRFKHEVALSPTKVKINLFSSLDKTLVLWQPATKRAGTNICFLRPRSSASAVEWYTFLRGVLGGSRANTLQVNIPDLNVSLRVDNPFAKFESTQNMADAAEGDEEAIVRTMKEEQAMAGRIVDVCMTMLAETGAWNDILPQWAENGRVGLAWKRYDRLEWIHGANERKMYGTIALQRTHELELRQKQHYPTTIKPQSGDQMTEPAPVEGFLIRLTSQKGSEQKLGKLFYKRLYFTTHNQYLLFLRPAKAAPPPPPKMPMQDNHTIPTVKQISEKIPLVFAVNPYPLDRSNNVSWLSPDGASKHDQRVHDRDAYDEASRNASALLNTDGFINLVDVLKVRKVKRGATPADEHVESGSDVDFDAPVDDTHQDDGTTDAFDDDRTFELLMKNGLVVRLQAFSKQTRKEWMKRLRALVVYWSIRVNHDLALFKAVRRQNLEGLKIDERAEAYLGSFAQKWEIGQSFASAELYNMCGISSCRSIHRSGVLFRKPRIHRTFVRVHVILAHGHLLIFEDTMRAVTGRRVEHIHHERIASIDLRGCYLYSGLITENDLLYQNRTFDNSSPGNHALPRMYTEDQFTSTDEDAMTCFVLWHSQKKGWFRGSKEADDVKEDAKQMLREQREEEGKGWGTRGKVLKRVSQLGVPGRSIVFKARSRAERDHWVLGIGDEIERVGQGEEVRVVGDQGGVAG